MNVLRSQILLLLALVFLLQSCANIVPPAGGPRDTTPPRLLNIMPKDSSINTRVTKLEMHFDEFVGLNNAATEITVSPILPFPITSEANLKNVVLKIPDSLLKKNTTYRISFGKAIQDVHENNVFKDYQYIFSTGAYFDSLKLGGKVMNAATGKAESNALIVLYDAAPNDSCVVRQKPMYLTHTESSGSFVFEGLPSMPMKIFAINDANNNLMYDGKDEKIAFCDSVVFPTTNLKQKISLNIFSENDSLNKKKGENNVAQRNTTNTAKTNEKPFSYTVLVDTTDVRKRTQEISLPIIIETNKPIATINKTRINLMYDSLGMQVETTAKMSIDSFKKTQIIIEPSWKENSVYTLRLLKGFVKDSLGTEGLPSKNIFRTKRQEDYAKLVVHLPTKYLSNRYLLEVLRDDERMYLKVVKDTMVSFHLLTPGGYSLQVIEDRNENGQWDHGILFQRLQPELVIPYPEKINLKAGWENIIDFEEEKGKK